MTKKFRVLLMACVSLLLSVTLIAVGSYALFTDDITIKNHLRAGKLNITLKRTYLETNYLTANGYLDNDGSDEIVDFTNKTDRNIFDITNADDCLIVPGCYYEATMELSNESNVAFGYWIEIVLTDENPYELAKQLKVEVTTYNEENEEVVYSKYVNEGLLVGNETKPIGIVPVSSASQTFKIKMTFVDDQIAEDEIEDNNKVMGQDVNFDIVVNAVQVTEA
jgi:hypothetical protein